MKEEQMEEEIDDWKDGSMNGRTEDEWKE